MRRTLSAFEPASRQSSKRHKLSPLEMFVRFDEGRLSRMQYAQFMSYLVRTRQAWTMPGRYGRAAADAIRSGIIDQKGKINRSRLREVM